LNGKKFGKPQGVVGFDPHCTILLLLLKPMLNT